MIKYTHIRKCNRCGRELTEDDYAWCKRCKGIERARNKRRKTKKELKDNAMALFGIRRKDDDV